MELKTNPEILNGKTIKRIRAGTIDADGGVYNYYIIFTDGTAAKFDGGDDGCCGITFFNHVPYCYMDEDDHFDLIKDASGLNTQCHREISSQRFRDYSDSITTCMAPYKIARLSVRIKCLLTGSEG